MDEEIPVISTKNRTRACRITHKSIYRELGIPNVRHRRKIADPGRLSPAAPVARLRDRPPGAGMAPHRGPRRFGSANIYDMPDRTACRRRLYTAERPELRHPVFPLEIAHCGRAGPVTFVYVDPGNDTITEMRHWGQSHEHVWAGITASTGCTVHVAAIGTPLLRPTNGRGLF